MTKENLLRVRRIYNIVLSIVIVIAGICLIAGCINIYTTGDKSFSPEIVASTFSGIALPVFICLGMIAFGFILDFFLPYNKEKTDIHKPYAFALSRLLSRRDLTNGDETVLCDIQKLHRYRIVLSGIRLAVFLCCGVVFFIYALDPRNYHTSDINTSMIRAMYVLVPCVVLSFGYSLFVTVYHEKSMIKEIELLKSLPTLATTETQETNKSFCSKMTVVVRFVILAVGIGFTVYGFMTGGTADVLTKAINICTECIGLG